MLKKHETEERFSRRRKLSAFCKKKRNQSLRVYKLIHIINTNIWSAAKASRSFPVSGLMYLSILQICRGHAIFAQRNSRESQCWKRTSWRIREDSSAIYVSDVSSWKAIERTLSHNSKPVNILTTSLHLAEEDICLIKLFCKRSHCLYLCYLSSFPLLRP